MKTARRRACWLLPPNRTSGFGTRGTEEVRESSWWRWGKKVGERRKTNELVLLLGYVMCDSLTKSAKV